MQPSIAYTVDRAAKGRLAQLVRAPALQAGCRGFESLTAHHYFPKRSFDTIARERLQRLISRDHSC